MAGKKRNASNYRRRHMKYLRNEDPFLNNKNEPIVISTLEGIYPDNSLVGIILLCEKVFGTASGEVLTNAEWRMFNKAEPILSAGPEDGYFAIEDADFEVVRKIVAAVSPRLLKRSSPHLEDLLNSASSKKSEPID